MRQLSPPTGQSSTGDERLGFTSGQRLASSIAVATGTRVIDHRHADRYEWR
jgi:hypothetical protein